MTRLVGSAVGIVLILVLLGVWSAARGPRDERAVRVPTTYSSGPSGARGLYLVFEDMGLEVSRSRTPKLAEITTDATLWTLAEGPLEPTQAHALAERVQNGGTVVLPAEPAQALFVALGHAEADVKIVVAEVPVKAHEVALDPKQDAAPHVTPILVGLPEPARTWAAVDGKPAVAEWHEGKGRVVLFAPTALLGNDGVRQLPVAELAYTVAHDLGPRHIFDESRTGFGEANAWTMVRNAPWRFGLVQLALALLLTVSILALRATPLMTLPAPHRRETREHVEAVAALWRRHGDAGLPLGSLMRALELRASRAGAHATREEPAFVAWVRWRAASRVAEARQVWTRATELVAEPRPRLGEIVVIAAQLRRLEMEVFRAR